MIWFKPYKIEEFQSLGINMVKHLDIEISKIDDQGLEGTMPVDEKTKQPFGLLHGGASCVLAETLGSVASQLVIDPADKMAVGQSLTANYLRTATSGRVTGRATALHLGKTTHIWDIAIRDSEDRLIAQCRLTTAIVPKKRPE